MDWVAWIASESSPCCSLVRAMLKLVPIQLLVEGSRVIEVDMTFMNDKPVNNLLILTDFFSEWMFHRRFHFVLGRSSCTNTFAYLHKCQARLRCIARIARNENTWALFLRTGCICSPDLESSVFSSDREPGRP